MSIEVQTTESNTDTAEISPLVENTLTGPNALNDDFSGICGRTIYTYGLSLVVFGLVVCLLYYSYTCFYENQELIIDPFIEKTVKTGTDSDKVFDVDGEINKLRRLQEKYLEKLNIKRSS
jgi:hypothetical protein